MFFFLGNCAKFNKFAPIQTSNVDLAHRRQPPGVRPVPVLLRGPGLGLRRRLERVQGLLLQHGVRHARDLLRQGGGGGGGGGGQAHEGAEGAHPRVTTGKLAK